MKKSFFLTTIVLLIPSYWQCLPEELPSLKSIPRTVSKENLLEKIANKANSITTEQKIAETKKPSADGQSVSTLKGQIKILHDEETLPEFRACFDGMQTFSNKEGFYTFPMAGFNKNTKYSIIISKNVQQNFENENTIKNLSIDPKKRYQYFSLKMTGTGDNDWKLKEKKLDKKNFIIPRNCLVLMIDPKHVQSVELWNQSLNSEIIRMPRITLKADARKKLDRASVKSLLYSLNSNPFHEKIHDERKVMPGGKGYVSRTSF
jgi:hypothetical protein